MLLTICVICSGQDHYDYGADLSMSDVMAGMLKC